MKAQLWEIKICSGPLEMAHGFSQKILEVYIPFFKISLNIEKDKINCFSTYEGRYSDKKGATLVKIFDFPDYIVDALLIYISSIERGDSGYKIIELIIKDIHRNNKIIKVGHIEN